MIFGATAFSDAPLDTLLDADIDAVPARFYETVANEYSERVYIAILKPYDSATDTIKTVYVATRSINTESGDTIGALHIPGALVSPLNMKLRLFVQRRMMGEADIDSGVMVVQNDNGDLDDWYGYDWGAREATLFMGEPDFAFDEFGLVWKGETEQLIGDLSSWTLRLRSLKESLKENIQNNHYTGAGGDEGTSNLAGQEKPLCFGYCKNISPVLVDPSTLRYQIHDGQIQSIDAVYFGGVLASIGSDYSTDVTNGFVDLVSASTGEVTCDIRGEVDTNNQVIANPDKLIKHIFKSYGGYTDDDIELTSFGLYDDTDAYRCGLFLRNGNNSYASVFSTLTTYFGGYWGINNRNKLFIGQVGVFQQISTDLYQEQLKKLAIDISAPITYKTRVSWQRSYTIQSRGTLAGGATETRVDFVENEYRWSVDEDLTIHPDYHLSEERDVLADFEVEATATAEAVRQQGIFGVERKTIKLDIPTVMFDLCICQTIRLFDRFNPTGKNYMITSIGFDVKNNKTDLEVWG